MHPVFKNRVWELDALPPWRVEDCEHCIEITQPEGTGALHISSARKKEGVIAESETLARLQGDCPEDTDSRKVRCGDFSGYVAEYVDWHTDKFWRKWFVACRKDLLYITYTCARGEEDLEVEQASTLLTSLRSKA
jgi:hypothetical protein